MPLHTQYGSSCSARPALQKPYSSRPRNQTRAHTQRNWSDLSLSRSAVSALNFAGIRGLFVHAEFISYDDVVLPSYSQFSILGAQLGRIGMAISVGATAPDFILKDQNQKEVKLSDFQGKKNVVVVFYPLDWSPVCTNEHACFVNDMKRFEQLDAQVLGISVDSAWSHKAFAEKMGSTTRCLQTFSRAAPSAKSSAFISRKRASPAAPSRSLIAREKSPGSKTTTSPRSRTSRKFPKRSRN